MEQAQGGEWLITEDRGEFFGQVGSLLGSFREQHVITTGTMQALRARGAPALFGLWREAAGAGADARVAAAFVLVPGLTLLVTGLPDGSAESLAVRLAERGCVFTSLSAPDGDAQEFVRAWATRAVGWAGPMTVVKQSVLYRLGTLVPPDPVPPGRAELALAADRELMMTWLSAFAQDVGDDPAELRLTVDHRIAGGQLVLWQAGGEPVAVAGASKVGGQIYQIAPVYTPPEHRNRGYAAAVTASAVELALEGGAGEVILFTASGNASARAVYGRLGFEEVETRLVIDL